MHWENLEGAGGEGGGRGDQDGNTCKPMAVSFQCMTKSTTNKKLKKIKKKRNCILRTISNKYRESKKKKKITAGWERSTRLASRLDVEAMAFSGFNKLDCEAQPLEEAKTTSGRNPGGEKLTLVSLS